MTNSKSIRIALGSVAVALMTAASGHAGFGHQNTLTFNRPVALPGVVLTAGSYSFDVASPTALDVVVVRSSKSGKVLYMGFASNMGAMIKPDGSFELNAVTPGEYQFRSFPNAPPGPDTETANAKVTVGSEDITDLHLITSKPVSVAGRVIVDPAAAQSLPASLFVTAFPIDGPNFGGSTPGRVADDYTFELKTSPGRTRISLSNPPAGWSIRAVRLNGADVIDSGIEFKPNQNVRGLEVELTNRVSVVTGLVTTGRSEASRDYTAIAFPQDSDRWKDTNSRYIRTGRPDQDGRFKISGLPSGDYLLIAVDHLNPGEFSDPEFLERVRTKATRFSLTEGETKSIDLKLNSSS